MLISLQYAGSAVAPLAQQQQLSQHHPHLWGPHPAHTVSWARQAVRNAGCARQLIAGRNELYDAPMLADTCSNSNCAMAQHQRSTTTIQAGLAAAAMQCTHMHFHANKHASK